MQLVKKSHAKYVGPARAKVLEQLACVGRVLLTTKLVESFTDMSVKECREFARDLERWLVKSVNNI